MFLKSSIASIVLPIESISSVFFFRVNGCFREKKKNKTKNPNTLVFQLRIFKGFSYILNELQNKE